MALFEMWYLGMSILVIIQQITILYLCRKLGGKNDQCNGRSFKSKNFSRI